MTVTKELICINCPMGCNLSASVEDGKVISVSGWSCRRGESYAREELTNPTRTVTALARVLGSDVPLSVKTERPIPKALVFDSVEALSGVLARPPVAIGDIILENVCGTGVNFVATSERKQ